MKEKKKKIKRNASVLRISFTFRFKCWPSYNEMESKDMGECLANLDRKHEAESHVFRRELHLFIIFDGNGGGKMVLRLLAPQNKNKICPDTYSTDV